ncbi:hypothetical protein ZWY2020_020790 [Hordeum vulgare]|nr:hypothetical protein ZWY2020_020790 [Hordeum vulgare]
MSDATLELIESAWCRSRFLDYWSRLKIAISSALSSTSVCYDAIATRRSAGTGPAIFRGRHELELGGVARAIRERRRRENKQHECSICGMGFEMGQALGDT